MYILNQLGNRDSYKFYWPPYLGKHYRTYSWFGRVMGPINECKNESDRSVSCGDPNPHRSSASPWHIVAGFIVSCHLKCVLLTDATNSGVSAWSKFLILNFFWKPWLPPSPQIFNHVHDKNTNLMKHWIRIKEISPQRQKDVSWWVDNMKRWSSTILKICTLLWSSQHDF